MNSVEFLRAGRCVLLGLAMAATPLGAVTVVTSSGPSARTFPIGKKIADASKITLLANDTITLLDSKGTRVLRGPGTFPAVQAASASRGNVFASLVRDRATVRVRTGSVRTGANGEPPRSPNLWYVDISRPGTYCLADKTNVRLWRPDIGKDLTVAITGPKGAGNAAFGANDMVAAWDGAKLPIEAGASYGLSGPGIAQDAKLAFVLLERQPAAMEDMAALLIEKGCSEQLSLLVSSVRLPDK